MLVTGGVLNCSEKNIFMIRCCQAKSFCPSPQLTEHPTTDSYKYSNIKLAQNTHQDQPGYCNFACMQINGSSTKTFVYSIKFHFIHIKLINSA